MCLFLFVSELVFEEFLSFYLFSSLGAVLNYVPLKGRDAYSYYGTYKAASVPSVETESVPAWQDADASGAAEAVFAGRRAKV
jgi:hypothetical protein